MEEVKEYKIARRVQTCNNHYWVMSEGQDKNSNLTSVNCRNCPAGASIDPNKFKVEKGKLCPR